MKLAESNILEQLNFKPEATQYQQDGDYEPYRTSRHAVSLNCISKEGKQQGISWSLFSDAQYTPSTEIVVTFAHKLVKIEGFELKNLYGNILDNRVIFIAEADQATTKLRTQIGKSVVSKLEVLDF